MIVQCDKCGSKIENGHCSCGEWFESEDVPQSVKNLEKVILDFNKSSKEIRSGDHHSGSCFVLFKGDWAKCMEVVEFIENYKD